MSALDMEQVIANYEKDRGNVACYQGKLENDRNVYIHILYEHMNIINILIHVCCGDYLFAKTII